MNEVVAYLSLALNVLFVAAIIAFWLQRVKIFHGVFHKMDTDAAVSFFDAYPVEPGDIVFLGDSITAGGQWSEIFPHATVRNRGIRGDRTEDLRQRLRQITAGKPRQIFLMIGTNDIGLGAPREQTLDNYRAILDQILRESPDTRLVVQSVLPRESQYHDQVVTLNAELSTMAQERGLTFVDLFQVFVGEDGAIQDELTCDSLHLSGQGYRKWHTLIESAVQN